MRASVRMAACGMLAGSGPGAALAAGSRLTAPALDGGAGLIEEGQGGGMAGHQLEHPDQLADGGLVIVDLHQQARVAQQAIGGVGATGGAGWVGAIGAAAVGLTGEGGVGFGDLGAQLGRLLGQRPRLFERAASRAQVAGRGQPLGPRQDLRDALRERLPLALLETLPLLVQVGHGAEAHDRPVEQLRGVFELVALELGAHRGHGLRQPLGAAALLLALRGGDLQLLGERLHGGALGLEAPRRGGRLQGLVELVVGPLRAGAHQQRPDLGEAHFGAQGGKPVPQLLPGLGLAELFNGGGKQSGAAVEVAAPEPLADLGCLARDLRRPAPVLGAAARPSSPPRPSRLRISAALRAICVARRRSSARRRYAWSICSRSSWTSGLAGARRSARRSSLPASFRFSLAASARASSSRGASSAAKMVGGALAAGPTLAFDVPAAGGATSINRDGVGVVLCPNCSSNRNWVLLGLGVAASALIAARASAAVADCSSNRFHSPCNRSPGWRQAARSCANSRAVA